MQFFQPWTLTEEIDKGDRWTVAELIAEMPTIVGGAGAPPSAVPS